MRSSNKHGRRRPGTGAKLGQPLLTNRAIAAKIARDAGAANGAAVLEVGPGKGILTAELLRLGARVVAVEKDPSMVAALHERFGAEIKEGALHLIEGDARDLLGAYLNALKLPKTYTVAANIPYYITGELIRLFLTAPVQPTRIALLVQKEVAERIARTKKESLLSLSVKAYGTPHYVQTVKAGSFNPPPKVDSAVLSIEDVSRKHFKQVSEEDFFMILHAGFGQKRKTLLGNLKRAFPEHKERFVALWKKLDLAEDVRAEDVPLDTWLSLVASK